MFRAMTLRATIPTVMLALVCLAGCKGTNLLSRSEEIRIGRQGAVEVEKQYGVSRNPADIALVEGIGQKIVAVNKLTWPYTFKVLNDKMVNAVSLPGGPVYVFRGLLDLTEGNEDEMALVIAHEIGHIENRHIAKMYSQGVLADVGIAIFTGGDVTTAAQIAQLFLSMKFSRDDEYQADSTGIRLAYKAGYDPNGMIRFFTKLQKLEKQGKGDIISNNLRTHPVTGARIERAKKEIEKIMQSVNAEAVAAAEAALQVGK
jgi:predicted Zn-dependent protease